VTTKTFEVLKAVTVFWDVIPCSPAEVHRCFGRQYTFHLQGKILSQEKTSMNKAASRTNLVRAPGLPCSCPESLTEQCTCICSDWLTSPIHVLHFIRSWISAGVRSLCVPPASWWFLPLNAVGPSRWRHYVPLKRRWTLAGYTALHSRRWYSLFEVYEPRLDFAW
jgi:hypothetical protein